MKDVLIVGSGIAGCSLAWKWYFEGKSVALAGDRCKGSSAVAAGVFNPTILKRFTSVWKAQEQLQYLKVFYREIEKLTGARLLYDSPILRRFHDDKEAQTWVGKAHREDLKHFIRPSVEDIDIDGIRAVDGFGLVDCAGWLDTLEFMQVTQSFFDRSGSFIPSHVEHSSLVHHDNHVEYNGHSYHKILFAEGYALRDNPFFNNLPLQGNKGEVITIKVPGLKMDYTVKSSVFIMPYKEDLFWVGATYNRHDLTDTPTQAGIDFLTSRLESFMTLPYEIIEHKYGIRPTTVDRRPFIGQHPEFKNYCIFNGMGSRAVLIAPWASQMLFDHLYRQEELHPEVNINRFNEGLLFLCRS